MDTSDKTNFWITSRYLTVCWRKVDGILHPSLTTTLSESSYYLMAGLVANSNILWSDETSSSETVLNYFYIMYQSISFIKHHFFLFFQTSLFINLISQSFDMFEFCTALNLLLGTFYLVWEFPFFVLFQMLWMPVTVNKATFSSQKTLINSSKTSLALG